MIGNLPDDFDHRAFEARYGDPCTRDLSEIAASYCIAKLAYAAGEDEAGDAAWSRLIDETNADEREQIADANALRPDDESAEDLG